MQNIRDKIERTFRGEIRFNEPMSAHTSLRIGGPVEVMVFPEDLASLRSVLSVAYREKIPLFILGEGTNLLVGDKKIKGMAISLRFFRNIFTKEKNDKRAVLFVEAGVPLKSLINFIQKNGYSGIEALAGIPGSFGGAVYTNAGSFGTEIKDVIVSITVMDMKGEIINLKRDGIKFSYRTSNLPGNLIILGADIVLQKDDSHKVAERVKRFLRDKRTTQPLGEYSAGCVFKNPEGDFAGRLIEAAGCKGLKNGDIEVSRVHANYFINKGRGTYRDFIELMKMVKTKVKRYSGVNLEPEIRIIERI